MAKSMAWLAPIVTIISDSASYVSDNGVLNTEIFLLEAQIGLHLEYNGFAISKGLYCFGLYVPAL